MRIRFFCLVPSVRKRLKTAGSPAPVNLAPRRRSTSGGPACLMAFDPQPPGEAKANVTA